MITSSSTAAFQDIISTVQRRAPSSQISLSEATVQGDNAHISIINALNRIISFNELNQENAIDVVILSRGGGSIEDLWCFNNEELAREIYSFPIPTISGVGHEIDFTICDFVADIRVPTPTASAELVTEFVFQLSDRLKDNKQNLFKNMINIIENHKQSIDLIFSRLKNPMNLLREKSQRLDNIDLRLQQNLRSIMTNGLSKVKTLDLSLKNQNPISKLNLMKERINGLGVNLNRVVEEKLKSNQNLLEKLYKNIQILNPLSILDRGYAIIMNESGIALKSAQETSKGEKLKARLSLSLIHI